MAKVGPRNLLEVSRLTGIPFTTIYHRIARIESASREISRLIPRVANLGMVRVVVLVAARAGFEDTVTRALKVPNYWRAVERCEGAFTHHSIQTIPVKFLKAFKEYVSTMHAMNLIKSYRILQTGDSTSIFPDFANYESSSGKWTFHWDEWLNELQTSTPNKTIQDPSICAMTMDKTDVQIIACLEVNGCMNFTDIAKKIDVSPQTVKYRYDKKLIQSGVLEQFHLDVAPYPVEISHYHEFMLEFANKTAMNRFYSLAEKLFFVDHISKLLRKSTLLVRTRMLQSQVSKLFDFFSEMTNLGLLNSYSAVRLDMNSRKGQTISFELFDETEGWRWDVYKNLLELNKL
jgi:DNA-binding Lrp family transcriptional regulator